MPTLTGFAPQSSRRSYGKQLEQQTGEQAARLSSDTPLPNKNLYAQKHLTLLETAEKAHTPEALALCQDYHFKDLPAKAQRL
jgi:hypothetical protein